MFIKLKLIIKDFLSVIKNVKIKNLAKKEFADIFKIDISTISRIEREKIKNYFINKKKEEKNKIISFLPYNHY